MTLPSSATDVGVERGAGSVEGATPTGCPGGAAATWIRVGSSRSRSRADEHFLTACRYVERNALRANLVGRAEDWRCCGLHRRRPTTGGGASWLSTWPMERPRRWALVNTAQTEAELAALRHSIRRGCPFGEMSWSDQMARRLGLEMTLCPHGRPKKQPNASRPLFFLRVSASERTISTSVPSQEPWNL